MNRGSIVTLEPNDIRYLASMRPRFMNRGSALPHAPAMPLHPASMRPRFMNRGSGRADTQMTQGGQLQ